MDGLLLLLDKVPPAPQAAIQTERLSQLWPQPHGWATFGGAAGWLYKQKRRGASLLHAFENFILNQREAARLFGKLVKK
ncbi:MAG TPA: hypothetical protein VFS21_05220 [Roseiflexaceae bacterium]|nr:hypothetical protein [Roseiflexaceae bacterium]